jgi:hypothetical protein
VNKGLSCFRKEDDFSNHITVGHKNLFVIDQLSNMRTYLPSLPLPTSLLFLPSFSLSRFFTHSQSPASDRPSAMVLDGSSCFARARQ